MLENENGIEHLMACWIAEDPLNNSRYYLCSRRNSYDCISRDHLQRSMVDPFDGHSLKSWLYIFSLLKIG